jgi:hypothetical protein
VNTFTAAVGLHLHDRAISTAAVRQRRRRTMSLVLIVTAWAVIEAAIAIALVANPKRRSRDPGSLFSGLADWRV